MIKAIIFDFGGVIKKDSSKLIFEDFADSFKITFLKASLAIKSLQSKYQKGELTNKEFFKLFSEKVKVKLPTNYQELWIKSYTKGEANQIVLKIIKKLKQKNYKLACLSNTIPPHLVYNKRKDNYSIFDVLVISCEVGMRKPEKDIFQYVLKKLNVQPEEALFIDDDITFINAAVDLKFKTIHFINEKQLETDLKNLKIL